MNVSLTSGDSSHIHPSVTPHSKAGTSHTQLPMYMQVLLTKSSGDSQHIHPPGTAHSKAGWNSQSQVSVPYAYTSGITLNPSTSQMGIFTQAPKWGLLTQLPKYEVLTKSSKNVLHKWIQSLTQSQQVVKLALHVCIHIWDNPKPQHKSAKWGLLPQPLKW